MSKLDGKLVIISAPSGTGKSTVIGEMMKIHPEFVFSVSATTRPMRPHEVDGRDYIFLTHDEFQKMIDNDELYEWAQYVGNFYGTPKQPILDNMEQGKTVLLDIEVQGAAQIMEKAPHAISIFIKPPSMEELEKRLRKRGTDSEEKLTARLKRAQEELKQSHIYKHTVINDIASRAAQEIILIIEGKK